MANENDNNKIRSSV